MPYKVLWEFLVCVLACKWIQMIGSEEQREHALFSFTLFEHLVEGFGGIENGEMVSRKMHL
jgi:hypothetical protein